MINESRRPTLDLVSLDEPAFQALYTARIEPILQAREIDRKTAVKTCLWRGMAGGCASLTLTAALFFLFGDIEVTFIGGALSMGAALWYAYEPVQRVSTATKSQSLHTISDAIGCKYEMLGFTPDGLEYFKELSLLPSCDRSNYQDHFSGTHHGCAFGFCDGHLEKKVRTNKSTSWRTVFQGQLIQIAFPKKFLGTTIVRRDAGLFNFLERWNTKLQRVGLNDSRLEKAFEVYSSDQVEARYLIHPVFMERLLDLEVRFKGKNLRCAFFEGSLLIAIEGGDKFEIGSMFKPLADITRVRSIIADLVELMRVIDAVLTAERGALPT